MIYGDYELWNRKGWPYDTKATHKRGEAYMGAIEEGTILRNDDWGVIYKHPEISWRLDRKIAHPVCVDNCLQDGDFTRTTAASLADRIKSLRLQSYRLNAFHTKQTSEDYVYDVCLQKNSANQYLLNVGLETYEAPFSTTDLKDFEFSIPIK